MPVGLRLSGEGDFRQVEGQDFPRPCFSEGLLSLGAYAYDVLTNPWKYDSPPFFIHMRLQLIKISEIPLPLNADADAPYEDYHNHRPTICTTCFWAQRYDDKSCLNDQLVPANSKYRVEKTEFNFSSTKIEKFGIDVHILPTDPLPPPIDHLQPSAFLGVSLWPPPPTMRTSYMYGPTYKFGHAVELTSILKMQPCLAIVGQ